jgi:hypothetical protein
VGIVLLHNSKNIRIMARLSFVKTMSVSDFKADMGISEIEVKRNPHTGKLFFVFGDGIGAVSERFEEDEFTSPVISQVCSSDTGELFYLLHQMGNGGCRTLARL